jgi:hypothetical protein
MVKLENSQVHARVIIEVVGKPAEYARDALEDHMKKIRDAFEIKKERIEKPQEQDGFYSTFAELEMIFEKPIDMIYFCFDYMPSSIEIIEPQSFTFRNDEFSSYLNDLQSRLHALNTGVMRLKDSNTHYIKNTAVLLRNMIVVILAQKPRKLEELVPLIGIKKEDIDKVIGVLIKEGKVKKQGDVYGLAKK